VTANCQKERVQLSAVGFQRLRVAHLTGGKGVAEQLSQLPAHPFRPLGRLCANRKSIARSDHFSILQNPHVPHAAIHVHPTSVGVVISDQSPEAFGLCRRRIGATSATARNATSVRRLALTPIRFRAQLRHSTRLLVCVFQSEALQEWPIKSNLVAREARPTTRRILPFRCPQRLARAVRQLPKSARFGRFVGSRWYEQAPPEASTPRAAEQGAAAEHHAVAPSRTFAIPSRNECS